MVSGGMTCVKYLLFVFNLLFAISGIAILSVGAIIQSVYYEYAPFVHSEFFTAPVILITVGVVIFIVAFFGCCGAVQENHCMIITFSVFLVLIFILEVAGGITGYVLRDEVKGMLDERLNATLKSYGNNTEVTNAWNVMQNDFQCCGIESYKDWKVLYPNKTLPVTCCTSQTGMEPCEWSTPTLFKTGCLPKLTEMLEHQAIVLGGVGIGIAFIQLLGVIFACCLARSIRREYESV